MDDAQGAQKLRTRRAEACAIIAGIKPAAKSDVGGIRPESTEIEVWREACRRGRRRQRAMTPQENQELKTYLEQQFGEIRERFTAVDRRFDGIDQHLERQDIDFNNTTKNLLLTIQDATKESRGYAARLFGILDRPSLGAADAREPAMPGRPKRPRTRPGR
jgi:hypothetical protein